MHNSVRQRLTVSIVMLALIMALFVTSSTTNVKALASTYAFSEYERYLLQNLAFKGWQGYNVSQSDLVAEVQIRVAGWVNNYDELMEIDGIIGPQTRKAIRNFNIAYGIGNTDRVLYDTAQMLRWLESDDGSTAHFNWYEFSCQKGNPYTWNVWYGTYKRNYSYGWVNLTTYQVKENVRRLMWRLEAVRVKAGNKPIKITSGFRYFTYNQKINGASDSRHIYGQAADISISGLSSWQLYDITRQSSFGGVGYYSSFVHVDTRDFVVRW